VHTFGQEDVSRYFFNHHQKATVRRQINTL
jgi:hypothetical protein